MKKQAITTDSHVYYIKFVNSVQTYVCNVNALLDIIKTEGQAIEYIMLFEKSKQKFVKTKKSLIFSLVAWNTELSELINKLYK